MAKDTKMTKKVVSEPEATKGKTEPAKVENVQTVELKRRALLQHYKNEDTISVNISPMYAKYFGKVMTVSIQGITVAIPCDGKTRKYNKTHAIEALSRLRKIDASITRKERMKDIVNNVETSPGEIKFY